MGNRKVWTILGICVAVVLGIGLTVWVSHRNEVLAAEHRIRKDDVFDANMAVTNLMVTQIHRETEFMKAGASQEEATALTLTDSFIQRRLSAQRDLDRANIALDAFYLAHPGYREK